MVERLIRMKSFMKITLLLCLANSMIACSSYRPVVDEDNQYQKLGSSRAESEIDHCLAKADRYLESHKDSRLLKEAGRGAAAGAMLGGVLGALSGNSRNLIAGAAVGAGVGAVGNSVGVMTKDKLSPDELKQQYVSNCLKRKNLVVIGWK